MAASHHLHRTEVHLHPLLDSIDCLDIGETNDSANAAVELLLILRGYLLDLFYFWGGGDAINKKGRD